MKIIDVNKIEELTKGDLLLVKGYFDRSVGLEIKPFKVLKLQDNEVILQKKGDIYFNFRMYLSGSSWVDEVKKVITD